jgi:secreted trypsin-like serine protease
VRFGVHLLISLLMLTAGCTPGKKSHLELQAPAASPEFEKGSHPVSRPNSRIVGGTFVDNDEVIAQSTVLIIRTAPGSTVSSGFCTGSLISRELVLTAAHCFGSGDDFTASESNSVSGENFYIYFGSLDPKKINKGLLRKVLDHRVHTEYVGYRGGKFDGSYELNDIAVIKFDPGAGLPGGFRPVSLVTQLEQLNVSTNGSINVTIAGFGPKSFDSPVFDLQSTDAQIDSEVGVVSGQITLAFKGKRHASKGDSGGPAFLEYEGETLLWGIDSTDFSYEPIARHMTWLREKAIEMNVLFN